MNSLPPLKIPSSPSKGEKKIEHEEEEKKEEEPQNVNNADNGEAGNMVENKREFVHVKADSNELSAAQQDEPKRTPREGGSKQESDRVSYSRAISLYRASNNGSI